MHRFTAPDWHLSLPEPRGRPGEVERNSPGKFSPAWPRTCSVRAVKIAVIEDEAMVRSMVCLICRQHPACERVAEAANGAAGLALCVSIRPDLVLLDIDLPDVDGLDLIDRIAEVVPAARIVVLSARTDDFSLHRCFSRHLHGFIDKNEQPIDAVPEAIDAAAQGRTYFSPAVTRARAALRDNPNAFSKLLSEREQNLLRLFGLGLSNDEIARRVSLSVMTVQNHRRNILGKLGLHSTPELIRYAAERGFTRFRPSPRGGSDRP